MKKLLLSALVALVLTGCGTAGPSGNPGSGSDPDTPDTGVSTDNTSTSDDGTGGGRMGDDGGGGDALRPDTVGDSPLHIDEIDVRVAESFPVQLFLHVIGNAPTPCHRVAYSIESGLDEIAVQLTTVASDGLCTQVLQPVDVTVPLGRADLPVTVNVNDGEFVTKVE